eukprot:310092-Chlamydomonas_euryale.AAC.2
MRPCCCTPVAPARGWRGGSAAAAAANPVASPPIGAAPPFAARSGRGQPRSARSGAGNVRLGRPPRAPLRCRPGPTRHTGRRSDTPQDRGTGAQSVRRDARRLARRRAALGRTGLVLSLGAGVGNCTAGFHPSHGCVPRATCWKAFHGQPVERRQMCAWSATPRTSCVPCCSVFLSLRRKGRQGRRLRPRWRREAAGEVQRRPTRWAVPRRGVTRRGAANDRRAQLDARGGPVVTCPGGGWECGGGGQHPFHRASSPLRWGRRRHAWHAAPFREAADLPVAACRERQHATRSATFGVSGKL